MTSLGLDAPAPVGFGERIWRINWGLVLILTAIAGVGVLALYSAAGGSLICMKFDTAQHALMILLGTGDMLQMTKDKQLIMEGAPEFGAMIGDYMMIVGDLAS